MIRNDEPRPLKIRDLSIDPALGIDVPPVGQNVLLLFMSHMDTYDLKTLKLLRNSIDMLIERKRREA